MIPATLSSSKRPWHHSTQSVMRCGFSIVPYLECSSSAK